MATFRCSIALLALQCAALSAEPDWKKLEAETLAHYTALLRIDTSNPPGNETKAARYVQGVLEKERIGSKLLALDPERANLVARIAGSGKKRPLLIMGHTDVVGVQRNKWTVDPFAGLRKDGYVYGRGAQDDKDNLAASLMVMLLLKRLNVKLDRDVIFAAESGEEGSGPTGINYLVKDHWKEIDAEYCLAEGGSATAQNGKVRYVTVMTTEKAPRGARLVAHGTASHGSRPTLDNAVVRLADAVAKVAAWQPPMRLNDTTRAYFERLASISTPEAAARYTHVADPARSAEIQRYFFRNETGHYSILRTSVVPTRITAGFRANVIPSEAEAYLDIRALPDENIERFYAELRRVIGDPKVEVIGPENATRPMGAPSRIDNEMFRALEKTGRRLFPGAVTLPSMLTGATDMAQLRARGVEAYGIGPIADEREAPGGGAHGDDERLAETALHKLVEYLWYAVLEVAQAPEM